MKRTAEWAAAGIILAAMTACQYESTGRSGSFATSYVEVSKDDPRYFVLSDGTPYIPVGCNIAAMSSPEDIRMYTDSLAANGCNFARVWLNSALFEVQTEYGKINEANVGNIRLLLKEAEAKGIKLKLCIESFRHILPGKNKWDTKASYHVSNGGPFESAEEFILSRKGHDEYLRRLGILKDIVGDSPAVFGWELWNEMNAVDSDSVDVWTEDMLAEVHKMFPHNLVMQSLGSLDRNSSFGIYEKVCGMPGNDVLQVHRYLDEGAALGVCGAPMDSLCSDAVNVLFGYGIDKPVMLAESGAVEPNHAGPSRFYPLDKNGMILHDVIFTPFFCGSAGCGQSWHWDHYIQKYGLWWQFDRFHKAIDGLNPVEEDFVPVRLDTGRLKGYALKGKHTLAVWYRDSCNTWKSELEEGIAPETLSGIRISLKDVLAGRKVENVTVYDPWTDRTCNMGRATEFVLPDFSRSVVVRVSLRGK